MMNIKVSYIILVILFVICSIGFFLFREQILFFLYGYDKSLIHASNADSFEAYKTVTLGKNIFLVFTMLLSLACAVTSFFIKKSKIAMNTYFVHVVYYTGIIVSVLLLIGFILGSSIPSHLI